MPSPKPLRVKLLRSGCFSASWRCVGAVRPISRRLCLGSPTGGSPRCRVTSWPTTSRGYWRRVSLTPQQVLAFSERLQAADGLVLSSPEYNYSMPGSFKNLFDWISTLKPMPWRRLNVFLMCATVSPNAGGQGLFSLRIPFDGCGAHVYPQNFVLRSAQDAFDDLDRLKEEALASRLDESLAGFQRFCRAMSADSGQ